MTLTCLERESVSWQVDQKKYAKCNRDIKIEENTAQSIKDIENRGRNLRYQDCT